MVFVSGYNNAWWWGSSPLGLEFQILAYHFGGDLLLALGEPGSMVRTVNDVCLRVQGAKDFYPLFGAPTVQD